MIEILECWVLHITASDGRAFVESARIEYCARHLKTLKCLNSNESDRMEIMRLG